MEPEFGGVGADYTLTASTSETDPFEPNNYFVNATEITVGEEVRGQLSIGDYDTFAITAERGETIEITASLDERPGSFREGGNVLVELYR